MSARLRLTFEAALESMKNFELCRRPHWPNGQYVSRLRHHWPNDDGFSYADSFAYFYGWKSKIWKPGWLPTSEDLMAEDWQVARFESDFEF